MQTRSLARWGLVLAAWLLGSLAVLLLLFRLAISQSDALTPRIEALLEARIGVPVTIEHLSLSLARSDLLLRLCGNARRPSTVFLAACGAAFGYLGVACQLGAHL